MESMARDMRHPYYTKYYRAWWYTDQKFVQHVPIYVVSYIVPLSLPGEWEGSSDATQQHVNLPAVVSNKTKQKLQPV